MDKSRQKFEGWINKNHPKCSEYHKDIRLETWMASRESLENERDQAIKHLILVFQQYANSDHLFMSAGENACEFLENLGYGIDTGRTLELTDKGKQLIKEDWE
ncbi:TPA: hypothetical protein SMQ16_002885 [Proteus mirabilis]|nr:hypothetical protein [Proteus mirabilis]MBG3085218.1 hypothetical protein [Proteus mirabilis]MBG3086201.1 hypothetical protein [Proteus mirabilis]MBG5947243.1 hypothetical protein [Proteus mirabilis]HEJ9516473.1 hypothetical protein [Proteus mirabilis]